VNLDRAKNHKKIIIKIQVKNELETRMNFIKIHITTWQKVKITKDFRLLLEGISLEILEAKNKDKVHKCTKMNKKLFL
jgi:hypothetical protein